MLLQDNFVGPTQERPMDEQARLLAAIRLRHPDLNDQDILDTVTAAHQMSGAAQGASTVGGPQAPAGDMYPAPGNLRDITADPYLQKAKALRDQATGIDAQAAPPPAGPMWQQALSAGIEGFGAGLAGKSYHDVAAQKQALERQREQDLFSRAKELRGEALNEEREGRLAGESQQNAEMTGQLRDIQRQQADAATAKEKRLATEGEAKNKTALRAKGLKLDPDGNVVPISEAEMGPEDKAKLAHMKAQDELYAAQTAYNKFKSDPNSIQFKQAAQRLAIAQQNATTAAGRLELGHNEFEAKYYGTVDGNELPGVTHDDAGNPVGPSVQKATNDAIGAQPKNQVFSAQLTKLQIQNVRDLITKNPEMVGPVMGRVNEIIAHYGGNPDAITGSTDFGTLDGHLAYLFLNEARAAMPGRPAAQWMEYVKEKSGQVSQNPALIEQYLRSAENNANNVLGAAAQAGYDPFSVNAKPTARPAARPTSRGGVPKVGETFNGARVTKVTPIP